MEHSQACHHFPPWAVRVYTKGLWICYDTRKVHKGRGLCTPLQGWLRSPKVEAHPAGRPGLILLWPTMLRRQIPLVWASGRSMARRNENARGSAPHTPTFRTGKICQITKQDSRGSE